MMLFSPIAMNEESYDEKTPKTPLINNKQTLNTMLSGEHIKKEVGAKNSLPQSMWQGEQSGY